MLAGLLIVNEGDAPGRPLGVEPAFILGRRAAAGRMNDSSNPF